MPAETEVPRPSPLPNGQYWIAHLQGLAVAPGQAGQRMSDLNLQNGKIGHWRSSKDFGGCPCAVDQHSLHIDRVVDDVLIGDDDP